MDVVGELRLALRAGLSADNAIEEFAGRRPRRITRERTIAGTLVRDSWFIDEDGSKLLGMRRERWVGERLQDNHTFRLLRYDRLASPAEADAALEFTSGRPASGAAGAPKPGEAGGE